MARALSIGSRLIMMDQGEIIMDLREPDKSSLTVEGLVDRFRALRNKTLADDRALLSLPLGR
jgi:putative ABC transport system ATP-binding protein